MRKQGGVGITRHCSSFPHQSEAAEVYLQGGWLGWEVGRGDKTRQNKNGTSEGLLLCVADKGSMSL